MINKTRVTRARKKTRVTARRQLAKKIFIESGHERTTDHRRGAEQAEITRSALSVPPRRTARARESHEWLCRINFEGRYCDVASVFLVIPGDSLQDVFDLIVLNLPSVDEGDQFAEQP